MLLQIFESIWVNIVSLHDVILSVLTHGGNRLTCSLAGAATTEATRLINSTIERG